MTRKYRVGPSPITLNGLGLIEGVEVNTYIDPPSIVSALGESAVKHHLALGAIFKRILKRDQFIRDFRQRWRPHEKKIERKSLRPH